MNFRISIILVGLVLTLGGCSTSGRQHRVEALNADVYKVWIEPTYAKSLRKLNGTTMRYQTIKIPRKDGLGPKVNVGRN